MPKNWSRLQTGRKSQRSYSGQRGQIYMKKRAGSKCCTCMYRMLQSGPGSRAVMKTKRECRMKYRGTLSYLILSYLSIYYLALYLLEFLIGRTDLLIVYEEGIAVFHDTYHGLARIELNLVACIVIVSCSAVIG